MELAEGIRKIGFRRWYERQLIESHLYLVTSFLCLVTVLACFEGFSLRMPAWETVMRLVAMLAGAAICVWTLRRYLAMLNFAVRTAERSRCEKCAAYSALELSGAPTYRPAMPGGDEEGAPPPVGVRCRKCGHEWTIE
jgi:hypothetical protein